ncbi:MAG: IS21 family transposase [Oscillospiraceae bacterium]|nr:IS21 family transposase [Oscillospiraceae bacterium]
MVGTELYGQIRRLRLEGLSQRGVARRLGVSRATVAKYWDGAHIPGTACRREPKESADKAQIKGAIRKYCEEHRGGQTRKHKINGHTLWRDLHYEYPRSEPTYRRYWAEIRGERQVRTRLPLSFKIAEAAEADWKMAKARIRGKELDLHVLCVNLMFGYTPFMKAYPDEKQHNLVDGLVSAMDFFQGSPAKIIMDNMTTSRKKGYGKKAELTDEFKLFAAHYGIEILFTNPYEAPEKGGAEVSAKTAGGVLTPTMDVDDICEVNDKLLEECMHYIERTGRVGNRPGTVKELTEQERPRLRPLPAKRYEVGVHGKATVSNQQLFKFDGFVYSAPRPCAGKEIGIIAYSFRVELYHRGARVWECSRPLFESENRVYAEHFIFDLDIKPRARENAFPLLEGILPPELDRFRKLCKSRTTKCHQLYMLMKKMEEVGREALLKAVDIANAAGSPTLAKVEALLHPGPGGPSGGGEPGMAELEDDFHVELRDPADYAALLGGD